MMPTFVGVEQGKTRLGQGDEIGKFLVGASAVSSTASAEKFTLIQGGDRGKSGRGDMG